MDTHRAGAPALVEPCENGQPGVSVPKTALLPQRRRGVQEALATGQPPAAVQKPEQEPGSISMSLPRGDAQA